MKKPRLGLASFGTTRVLDLSSKLGHCFVHVDKMSLSPFFAHTCYTLVSEMNDYITIYHELHASFATV